MEEYEVIRPFRWKGKNLHRNDTLTPQTTEEEFRCHMIMNSGYLAPILMKDAARILEASKARYIRVANNKKKRQGAD